MTVDITNAQSNKYYILDRKMSVLNKTSYYFTVQNLSILHRFYCKAQDSSLWDCCYDYTYHTDEETEAQGGYKTIQA